MLCSRLHYQKGLNLFLFSFEIQPLQRGSDWQTPTAFRSGWNWEGEVQLEKKNDSAPPRTRTMLSSHRMYSLIGFKKFTPPQNRQIIVFYYLLKYQVDGFEGKLAFLN
jgi:hypothetical protein